jgi:hypothetical protein
MYPATATTQVNPQKSTVQSEHYLAEITEEFRGWAIHVNKQYLGTFWSRTRAEESARRLLQKWEASRLPEKIPVTLHKGLTCSILTAKTGTLVVKEPRFNIDTIWNVHDGAELVSWAWTRQEAEDKARVLLQERKS